MALWIASFLFVEHVLQCVGDGEFTLDGIARIVASVVTAICFCMSIYSLGWLVQRISFCVALSSGQNGRLSPIPDPWEGSARMAIKQICIDFVTS